MACPKCKSPKVRKTVDDVLQDAYLCENETCGHSFKLLSPRAKIGIAAFAVASVFFGLPPFEAAAVATKSIVGGGA